MFEYFPWLAYSIVLRATSNVATPVEKSGACEVYFACYQRKLSLRKSMCRRSSYIEENKVASAKDTRVRQEEKSSMQMHTWTFLRDFSWPANKAFDLHTRDRRPFHRSSWITPRHWTRPCWPMFHLPFLTHRFLDADLAQFYIEITNSGC